MRVAFLVPGLGLGGAERAVINLANGLVDSGWFVHLIVFGPVHTEISRELRDRVTVSTTGRLSAANPLLWLITWWRLRGAAPQIVIGWSTYANLVASLLRITIGRWRVVVVERNYPPLLFGRAWTPPFRRWLVLRLMRWLYRRADAVGANSDVTLKFLRRYLNTGRRYIKFSNSIALRDADAAAHEPLSDPPTEWGGPRLLAVGRLSHQKGFDVLLRALADVRRQYPWRLVIVGDGEERASLRALAEDLQLGRGLLWVGSRANPFPYYSWADIVVSSSRYEGSPNVLLEAMALGKATISTDCRTGPRELTDRGRSGLLVPVGDVRQLAAAIVKLGLDQTLRETLAGRARAQIATYYERDRVVLDVARSLGEMVNEAPDRVS